MPISSNNRISVLKKAALTKREETMKRVITAIKNMKAKDITINFESVSKYAKVSKTWLYRELSIRQQINELRGKSDIIKRTYNLHDEARRKGEIIAELNNKVTMLKETIVKLRAQLEVVYGELYSRNSSNA